MARNRSADSFLLLREIAERRREDVLRALGLLIADMAAKSKRLRILVEHRDRLEREDSRGTGASISPSAWTNRLAHAERVEEAIRQATRDIELAQEKIDAQRQLLTPVETRRKGFDILVERAGEAAARQARKSEQKMADEWSATVGRRRDDADTDSDQ